MEMPGITVTSLFPHYVDAQQSAMRGLHMAGMQWMRMARLLRGPIADETNAPLALPALRITPLLLELALDARTTWRTSCRDQN